MAGRLARAFDAEVWLIHIIDSNSDPDGDELGKDHSRRGMAQEVRRKRRVLQLAAVVLTKQGTRAVAHVVHGSLVARALQEMKHRDPDCIIIGRRRHHWLYRLLQRGVGAAVYRRARCPVLTVPVDGTRAVPAA